jgi:hypothetical protein
MKNILKTFLASDLIGDLVGEIFRALQPTSLAGLGRAQANLRRPPRARL